MLKEINNVSFLNIDNDKMYFEYADKDGARFDCYDLTDGLPINLITEPVVFINMSQFFEHLNLPAATRLIDNCYQVMDYGAKIRISVPDAELLLFHLKTNKMDKFKEQQPKQWYDKYQSQMIKFALILFGSLHENGESGHKMCYDYESLKEILAKAGFTKIKRVQYDSRYDAEVGENHQLAVEAIK